MLSSVLGAGGLHTALLPAVTARDVDVLVQISVSRVTNAYVSLIARRGSGDYRGRLRLGSGGGTFLQAAHAVGETETFMGSEANAAVPYAAGTKLWVRMQVLGASPTTVRMRIWADGSSEPSTWPYSVTDATSGLQVAGTVGLNARLSSSGTAPTVFSFDGFRVTTL